MGVLTNVDSDLICKTLYVRIFDSLMIAYVS